MGFSNSIIGGAAALVRAAIRSPNFQHQVSGWSINKDGSAEFNNETVRGTFNGTNYLINAAGAFFYSGTPALGNLVASVTNSSGTDSSGNAYLSGITSYNLVAGTATACQVWGASMSLYVSTSGAGGPYTSFAGIGSSTSGSTGHLVLTGTDGTITLPSAVNNAVTFSSNVNIDGTLTIVNANSLVTGDLNMSPLMSTPPNAAAVAAGTATLAQTEAFANGMYQSMKNRGMFN